MILMTDIEEGTTYLVEKFSRQELLDMLSKGTAVISFKKRTNGKYRLLYGTRRMDLVPKNRHPSGVGLSFDPRAKGLIIVFDLIKKQWRSFAVDNVQNAAQRSLSWLAKVLRRRKYTKDSDQVRESVAHDFEVEAFEVNEVLIPENAREPEFKGFLEMASGRVGAGAESAQTSDSFIKRLNHLLIKLNRALERNGKFVKLGTIRNTYDAIAHIDDGYVGVVVGPKGMRHYQMIDDPDQIVFACEAYQETYVDLENGLIPVIVSSPMVRPDTAKSGLAASVYQLLSKEFNIVADNVQSKQARLLWRAMCRNKTFPYMYLYNEASHTIEAEINGDVETFERIMLEGDEDMRFVGTSIKSRLHT